MSTLIEELEQAARRVKCGAPGWGCFGCPGCALADALTARAAHVREMQRLIALPEIAQAERKEVVEAAADTIRTLVGPLPGATQ